MMPSKLTAFLLLLQLNSYFGLGSCGKVLVWPMEYSHWINLKTILDVLIQKGHEVIVLRFSAALSLDVENGSAIKFEDYPVSITVSDWITMFAEGLEKIIFELPKESTWGYFSTMQELVWKETEVTKTLCKDTVLNKELMSKLQKSRFDVILADAFMPCSELIAEILNVPFVYTHRLFPGYTYEKYSGALPVPPSYVPVSLSQLSDQMTFAERVKNMMCVLYYDFWFQTFNANNWNQFYSDVLGRPTTLYEIMGKADMWLIRTYWDLDFPRPSLPNFDFVGGLHCKPAKPLPKEMEEFVQSSGDHGVVLFSLGSMVMNMTEDRANVIASALAQIPQKVIWRYGGKKPATLGPNTQLYKWIPQNDLLGHPKTKAFISHGGTNGVYEAIYHGVPMVGIPLFWDQGDNVARLEAKGAAVRLELLTMSSADLVNAVKTVINDPSYKENVMRLSRIHHDQPVKPLDRAVFWVEFVMRHKGAKHLRVAAHDLSWFQYHSLDVIGFLLACVATVMFLITKCCLLCCRKFAKTGKQKKRE